MIAMKSQGPSGHEAIGSDHEVNRPRSRMAGLGRRVIRGRSLASKSPQQVGIVPGNGNRRPVAKCERVTVAAACLRLPDRTSTSPIRPCGRRQHVSQAMNEPTQRMLEEAIAAQVRGAFEDAKRLYRRVLKIHSRNAIAWGNLAIIAAQEGNIAEAEKLFRAALAGNT